MKTPYRFMISAVASAGLAACGDDNKTETDAEFRAEITAGMQSSITAELNNLIQAAKDLQTAAPTHAWDVSVAADASALVTMKAAWQRTRVAYEHVEGATAPIFPDLDATMDARYEDFVEGGPDDNVFDAEGVTGMHGIERILFAADIRPEVIAREQEHLPTSYTAASYPTSDADAVSFKTVLVQKLIDDATSLRDQWTPQQIDIDFAFGGLVGLMNEQGEKVDLAATGEEESRYANLTMFDLRNNLDGTKKIYDLFRPWIQSKANGATPDAAVEAKLSALTTLYATIPGDSIPDVPSTWSALNPSAADLMTSFGTLWKAVRDDVDETKDGSVVFEMNLISTDVLDLKQPTE